VNLTEQLNKVKNENSDNEEEQQQINSSTTTVPEDFATMDLSSFCMAVKRDSEEIKSEEIMMIKIEPSDELKRDSNEINDDDDDIPLDLSCPKSKRSCHDDYWTTQHTQAAYPLPKTLNKFDQFQELNGLVTAVIILNDIKRENIPGKDILDLTNSNLILSTSIKQESSANNFKQIEQTIREKFQYSQPLPIPDGKFLHFLLTNNTSRDRRTVRNSFSVSRVTLLV
jgi:hypothetical protein